MGEKSGVGRKCICLMFARFFSAKRVKKICSCYTIEYGYDVEHKKRLDGGLS